MNLLTKPWLLLLLLLVVGFTMSTSLEPQHRERSGDRGQTSDLLAAVLGDGRRMFANHFFVKADKYFHSGFYPTVFHNKEAYQTAHIAEDSGAAEGKNEGDEHDFMGQPKDWIDRFGRSFFPAEHTHLEHGGVGEDASEIREILPWLQLSARMDPKQVEIYVTTAYWLRKHLHKPKEAEEFLREGLRENPDSAEILFELGRLQEDYHKDVVRARNLWELGLRRWRETEGKKAEPNTFPLLQLASHLALLEDRTGNHERALALMQVWKSVSPVPEEVDKHIAATQAKLGERKGSPR